MGYLTGRVLCGTMDSMNGERGERPSSIRESVSVSGVVRKFETSLPRETQNLQKNISKTSLDASTETDTEREARRYRNFKDFHKGLGYRFDKIAWWLLDDGKFFLPLGGAGLAAFSAALLGTSVPVFLASAAVGLLATRYIITPTLAKWYSKRSDEHHDKWITTYPGRETDTPEWD